MLLENKETKIEDMVLSSQEENYLIALFVLLGLGLLICCCYCYALVRRRQGKDLLPKKVELRSIRSSVSKYEVLGTDDDDFDEEERRFKEVGIFAR